jgi:hypothetical protein
MSCTKYLAAVALCALLCTAAGPALAGADGNSPLVLPPTGHGASAKLLRARHDLALREAARRARPRPPRTVLLAGNPVLTAPSSLHDLRFDFAKAQVTAIGKLQIKNNGAAPVSVVYLYMERFPNAALTITDGSATLSFTDLGYDELQVTLGTALGAGETVELTATQVGLPDCKPGFVGMVPCQVDAGLTCVMGSNWTPLLIDESTSQLVDADSETLKVTLPAGLKAAAAALDGNVTTNTDGTTTTSFQMIRGVGVAFAGGPLLTGQKPLGSSSQVRTFVLAANSSTASGWRDAAVDIMTFHGQRYGAYDLSKIDVVEAHPNAGVAYGPLSAIFIPGPALADPPADWMSRTTMAHELGHQWFAGFIQLGDSYSPWVNEGFATFTEMEYTIAKGTDAYKQDYGPAYRAFNMLQYVYGVLGQKDVALSGSAIYEASNEVYVVVTYNKGGMLVSMIRYLLGDSNFVKAMAQYRQDHLTSKSSPSSLAASIKTATGTDVWPMISAWSTKAGYPTVTVEVLRSTQGTQFVTQVNATATKPLYLPVQLDLQLADGTVQHQQLAMGSSTSQSASFTTDSEVTQVRWDPAAQVLARSVGKLPGDIAFDGEVDGIDLIQLAWAMGRTYDAWDPAGLFPAWTDLVFDGTIDQRDADVLLGSFGKKAGE